MSTTRAAAIAITVLVTGCGGPDHPPLDLDTVRPPTGDRVLLVGVDALTWHVLQPLIAAGALPTFSRLVDEGYAAVLMSMEPTLSPALWTTIATGRPPEAHGIRAFLDEDHDGGGVPVTSNMRQTHALWTMASAAGRRVNVIGWYVTWPAETINGVLVSDRFSPTEGTDLVGGRARNGDDEPVVSPPALGAELLHHFIRVEDFLRAQDRNFHEMTKVYPVDATRIAIAKQLMEERPADLTMLYLRGIDPVQHLFWKYYEPFAWVGPDIPSTDLATNRARIPDYYRDVDGFLQQLLDRLGPQDTLLVVSDHGAGPVRTYDERQRISGDHRLEGVVLAWGKHVRPGFGRTPASLLDVTPTVLYLLDLPLGADMPGAPIEAMLSPALLASRPIARVRTWETGTLRAADAAIPSPMDEEIKTRLRELGYIE